MKRFNVQYSIGWLGCLFLLTGCQCDNGGVNQTLKSRYVSLGKPITVKLNWKPKNPSLTVAGRNLPTRIEGNNVTFTLPKPAKNREVAWGGPRELKIIEKNNIAKGVLKVLGNTITEAEEQNTLMLVTSYTEEKDVKAFISQKNKKNNMPQPINKIQLEPLGSEKSKSKDNQATNFCGGSLVVLQYKDGDYEDALTALDEAAENDDNILGINPVGTWVVSQTSEISSEIPMNAKKEVNAQYPHKSGLTGKGKIIAILDTGVNNASKVDAVNEFGARLLPGRQFTKAKQNDPDVKDDFVATPRNEAGKSTDNIDVKSIYGHGTQVASLAAGTQYGIAPKANILPVKICDSQGKCRTSDVLRGVCWALNTVHASDNLNNLVLNMSVGADTGDFEQHALKVMMEHALKSGVSVVASAGNQWADYLENKKQLGDYIPYSYPAALDLEDMIAVGAVRKLDVIDGEGVRKANGVDTPFVLTMAPYSNRGKYVDILAPGSLVRAIDANGFTESRNRGTSYAGPQVAGAVALWKQKDPSLTPAQIKQKIVGSANTTRVQLDAADTGQVTNRFLNLIELSPPVVEPELY